MPKDLTRLAIEIARSDDMLQDNAASRVKIRPGTEEWDTVFRRVRHLRLLRKWPRQWGRDTVDARGHFGRRNDWYGGDGRWDPMTRDVNADWFVDCLATAFELHRVYAKDLSTASGRSWRYIDPKIDEESWIV